MEKILNIITIRRVLKCSFALLLIAGRLPFLTASGKNYILMDFGGKEITQKGVLEKVQEFKKNYIRKCQYFIEEFRRLNKRTNIDAEFGPELVRGYLKPLYEFILSDDCAQCLEQYRPYFECDEFYQKRGLQILEFFVALKALKSESFDKDTKKWEEALYEELTNFVKETFREQFQSLNDQVQAHTEIQGLQMNFILQNGTVTAETACELFEDFEKPFRLTFSNVEGTFCAGEQLKRSVVMMRFINSRLEFVSHCFEGAPLLKELNVVEKTSFFAFGERCFENCPNLEELNVVDVPSFFAFGEKSFAGCPKLQSPFRDDNENIKLTGTDNLLSAFEGFKDDKKKKESVQKVASRFYFYSIEKGFLKDIRQAYKYLTKNELDPGFLFPLYSMKLGEAEEKIKSLIKECDALKKLNERLEKSNKSLSKSLKDKERPVAKKNDELKQSIKKKEDEVEKMSKALSKYEKLVAQYKTIIEEKEKKSEESRQSWDRERLHGVKLVEENKVLRDEIKALKKKKEELEETIITLEEEGREAIRTVPTLKAENEQLKKQLADATKERDDAIKERDKAKEMLNNERERNKAVIKEKKQNIAKLEKELAETQKRSLEYQKKIKELQTSESYVLKTMDMFQDEEEPKEEVKNDDSQLNFSKNTFQQKQNTNGKNFYPKKKSKKRGKYMEFNYQW